ncbi:hypothetical protein [Gordonia sp. (in: high G+C Gram-positive bacteria)]|uniref:hypothetical protein n=1 Tax=Gordonia sp. (in: high G+C Gram-positive bacteria) TaxID=84139 RepID=UPI003C708D11
MSDSPYELWVVTLRTWSRDPSTDLSRLPTLAVDSFPPGAYERFFRHVGEAIDAVNSAASSQLDRDIGAARNPHEIAAALVAARPKLARRLQLARHPGLPKQIREVLETAAAKDISRMQAELETMAASSVSRYGSDRLASEQMLHLVRQNPLTAVLQAGAGMAAVTSAPVQPSPVPQSPPYGGPRVRRQIYRGPINS